MLLIFVDSKDCVLEMLMQVKSEKVKSKTRTMYSWEWSNVKCERGSQEKGGKM